MDEETNPSNLVELTADIVSAFVSNNAVVAAEMPQIIDQTYDALANAEKKAATEQQQLEPAVPIKKSVGKDTITCLECGKRFKSLRRHLRSSHGTDADEYRARWNLPSDYPMASPSYSAQRSAMAKKMGLGRK